MSVTACSLNMSVSLGAGLPQAHIRGWTNKKQREVGEIPGTDPEIHDVRKGWTGCKAQKILMINKTAR